MPSERIPTDKMLQKLFKTGSIKRFIKYHNDQMNRTPFNVYDCKMIISIDLLFSPITDLSPFVLHSGGHGDFPPKADEGKRPYIKKYMGMK